MATATHDTTQRYAESVSVGDDLTPQERRPTTVQLFRYCAITWNSHRIHYDKDYAASEGYPDVLVQSHLHGAYLTSLCTDFAGEKGCVERLSYSVRRFATPGDVLNVIGRVTEASKRDSGTLFRLEISEVRTEDEAVCASGEADVFLPSRPATAEGRTS
ncbi:acyl dehydratase [Streptomyces sp. NPDC002790]|uniref:acyl dehydratase n=1 Tax=Streptomyces sp. NPDC002790 TaxID=3154431 RepID=UPI00331E6186